MPRIVITGLRQTAPTAKMENRLTKDEGNSTVNNRWNQNKLVADQVAEYEEPETSQEKQKMESENN
jgi:hypothetical protein